MRAYSRQAAKASTKTAAEKGRPPQVTKKTATGIPTIAVKIRLNKTSHPLNTVIFEPGRRNGAPVFGTP